MHRCYGRTCHNGCIFAASQPSPLPGVGRRGLLGRTSGVFDRAWWGSVNAPSPTSPSLLRATSFRASC
eukprot:5343047-Pleurochrysis_carterae.AAC.1